jgi:hypothetical protein
MLALRFSVLANSKETCLHFCAKLGCCQNREKKTCEKKCVKQLHVLRSWRIISLFGAGPLLESNVHVRCSNPREESALYRPRSEILVESFHL